MSFEANQLETASEITPKSEQNELDTYKFDVLHIDDFLDSANKKMDMLFKTSPEISSSALKKLNGALDLLRDQAKILSSDREQALDDLHDEISEKIEIFENLAHLTKLTGEKIEDPGQRQFEFEHAIWGKTSIKTDDYFRVISLENERMDIHFLSPLSIDRLILILNSTYPETESSDKSKGSMEVELLDDGNIKVSEVKQGNQGVKVKVNESVFNSDGKNVSATEFDSKTGKKRKEVYFKKGLQHIRTVKYNPTTEKPRFIQEYEASTSTNSYFDPETGKLICKQVVTTPGKITFFTEDGTEYNDYNSEKRENPNLTPEEYTSMLAKVFNKPQYWQLFNEVFVDFTFDTPEKGKLLTKKRRENYDKWQSSKVTINKSDEMGHFPGDCEDIAFLTQAILEQQGIKAHVVYIPGHALCAWIQKDSNGRYHAYSIDTYGYDKNGDHENNQLLTKPQEIKEGYSSPQEALNSLFRKYKQVGTGVKTSINYQITDSKVTVLSISNERRGKGEYKQISVEQMVNP